MLSRRTVVLRALGVVAVFVGTIVLAAASVGGFARPPVTHTSLFFERDSPLGLAAVLLLCARFMWPFAVGAFVLERFVVKRRGFWWALALGILPTLAFAAAPGHSTGSGDTHVVEYLAFGLLCLSPTLWALLGFSLGYVFRQKTHA